jgi:hypothetical protein
MTLRIQPSPFLRNALRADAAISAVAGAAMLFGAALLAPPTGLPEALLFGAGLAMIPFVAYVAWLSGRPTVPVWMVWSVIGMNAVWAVDCAWAAFGAGLSPTGFGLAFLAMQAATVLVLAELEFTGLRRARGGAMA